MTTLLTVKDGKIEIHADIRATDTPPAFTTKRAHEAARYLFDHNILEWANSSSMDFAEDYGWHRNDAAQEIVEEMEKLAEAQS